MNFFKQVCSIFVVVLSLHFAIFPGLESYSILVNLISLVSFIALVIWIIFIFPKKIKKE